ncbi:glycosyltransferase family 2 protein [bacterium]|nr:glycosyltransferase family 2 protein [bacterium]
MNDVKLSYIVTTRNKLPFLTHGLNRLIQNLQSDEEVIVVDAGSTDNTIDFLRNLYKEGKIHQFISESDHGEGHGYNKGILLANGILIKVITDDDFFNFEAIQECKNIMLDNNHLDVIIGNVCNTNQEKLQRKLIYFLSTFLTL